MLYPLPLRASRWSVRPRVSLCVSVSPRTLACPSPAKYGDGRGTQTAKGKRREKGDGSLYPRKNRAGKVIGWFGAYTAEDGKRRRVYAKTREEAKALLTRAIADAEAGVLPSAREPDVEVAEYLASWLSDCQASLKVTSYRRYEHSVQKHLAPAIGGVQLSKLPRRHSEPLSRKDPGRAFSPVGDPPARGSQTDAQPRCEARGDTA